MRVLIWSETFWPATGGVEVFLSRLVRDLVAHGHDVEVLTAARGHGRPDDDLVDGVPVHRLPLFEVLSARRPDALLQLKRTASDLVGRFRPDVTNINLLGPGAALLLDAVTGPIVVSLHATFLNLRSAGQDTLVGRVLQRATWVTAVSQESLDSILAIAPALEARSSVILLGVDVPDATPSPITYSPPHLVGVGRLVPMKGFDLAIDALVRIRPAVPDIHLTIAGDGPERASLEEAARLAGVADIVHFAGWQPQAAVFDLMAQATLVVVPSRATATEYTEGGPLVVLEAAAVGRPVVATRAGGMISTVVDGVTGVLVEPENGVALAQAILDRVADPAGTSAMGMAARAHAWRLFRWDACFDAFHSLFTTLAESR